VGTVVDVALVGGLGGRISGSALLRGDSGSGAARAVRSPIERLPAPIAHP
jgi:hypothetical protein